MAYGLYDGSIESIPFLGGWTQQQRINDEKSAHNLRQATGQTSLLAQIHAQQQEAQLEAELQRSGGDVEQAAQAALKTGNIAAAAKLTPLLKLTRDQKITEQLTKEFGNTANITPEQAEAIGFKLSAIDHPGAAAYFNLAKEKRAAANNTNDLGLLRSQPQGMGPGEVVPGTASPDKVTMTEGNIPPQDMPAFLKAAQATAAGQPATFAPQAGDVSPVKGGGAYAALMQSSNPAIANRARFLQMMVDSQAGGKYAGSAATLQKELDNLTQQDARLSKPPSTWHATQRGFMRDGPNGPEPVTDASGNVIMPGTGTGSQYVNVQSDGSGGWVGMNKDTNRMERIPAAPDAKGSSGVLGSREASFINRVVLSGNEAARDLENVVKLPMTSSTGIFGGRGQSAGIFNAGKETLANKMTSQDVQTYNVMATGFQRALASIEAAGLMPTNTLSNQMERVLFREGDTNLTKLQKLAQTRQIVEAGLETISSNPRVPKQTLDHINQILGKIKKAVPFTQADLIDLQQAQQINGKATLKDVLELRNKGSNGQKQTAEDFFK